MEGQAKPGHKKNQYSTIVKSNYQNLVENNSDDGQQLMSNIELEVF